MPISITGKFQPSGGAGSFDLVSASDILDDIGLSITYVIDGGGSVISTGIKGDLEIPFGCTITRATLVADQTGSIVIDIWKDTYCVDEETEVLTALGWKKYQSLEIGENILSYDPNTELSSWKPLEKINIFDYEGAMFKLGGLQFGAVVTPNHRWLIEKTHGRKRNTKSFSIKETKNLGYSSQEAIVSGGEYNAVIDKTYSDEFIDICAWYFTEGSLRPNEKAITITQNEKINKTNCELIESSLKLIGGEEIFKNGDGKRNKRIGNRGSERRIGLYFKKQKRDNDCLNYFITGHKVDEITDCIVGKNKVPSTKFIRKLTKEQLERFIRISILGDGVDGTPQFTQMNKKRTDMYQMICVLAGYSPTITSDYKTTSLNQKKNGKKLNRIYLNSLQREVIYYQGKIWCPTVENHLWFARRKGKSFITGNSNYPPTVADTITASAKPTISSATKSQDSTLTGWTTAIAAGDILRFNVDSASTVTRVTLGLKVTKT